MIRTQLLPQVVPGERDDRNPPHFRMTQEENPDFSAWRESGMGIHGYHSHLHDWEAMAKNIAIYYGMVTMMDKHIGQILDRLDGLGMTEDTLVVFTTDHGHLFGQHGMIAKGGLHYEDLVRLYRSMPREIPAGQRSSALQSPADLPTTFLSWADIEVPEMMVGVDQGLYGVVKPRKRETISSWKIGMSLLRFI